MEAKVVFFLRKKGFPFAIALQNPFLFTYSASHHFTKPFLLSSLYLSDPCTLQHLFPYLLGRLASL